MASSSRSFALRHSLSQKPCLPLHQRRWAQVHDIRFVTTHRQPDSVLEKYKAKLERKAREEGLPDTSALKDRYAEKIQALKKKVDIPLPSIGPLQEAPPSRSPFPPPPPAPRIPQSASQTAASTQQQAGNAAANKKTPPGIPPLSTLLDVEKLSPLGPAEIAQIWRARFASSPNSLCAVIPVETFNRIATTARRHPQFILPIPRAVPQLEGSEEAAPNSPLQSEIKQATPNAAEIHFLQWSFPSPHHSTVLFTHLAEYKLRGEYAQAHTTVTHYMDLVEEKGVVLMKGEVVKGRGVSVDEGRWLIMGLQKFYGADEGGKVAAAKRRKGLLEGFSSGDEGFRVEDLVDEAEKLV
ncbi:hypothetical protein MMC25_003867 [Agyrium rufum]|nr:hypothetical protein [Agyrium rufum]